MNLRMQNADTGLRQDLPAGDNLIVTGPMADCVSVIVLYNGLGVGNAYNSACGWHGLGGAQAVNMANMMEGVPNDAITQVIIIPGFLQQDEFSRNRSMRHVTEGLGAHPNVVVRMVAGISDATVNRHGIVTATARRVG